MLSGHSELPVFSFLIQSAIRYYGVCVIFVVWASRVTGVLFLKLDSDPGGTPFQRDNGIHRSSSFRDFSQRQPGFRGLRAFRPDARVFSVLHSL